MTIAEMSRRFESVNLRQELPKIIDRTKDDIISLNHSQLRRGKDSDDEPIYPFYSSNSYAIDKNNINSLPGFGVPDLYNTGSFYNQFNIAVNSDTFTIYSTDSKMDDLVEKYSDNIFGLTKENKTVYSFGAFFNGVKKYIQDKTGVQFT